MSCEHDRLKLVAGGVLEGTIKIVCVQCGREWGRVTTFDKRKFEKCVKKAKV